MRLPSETHPGLVTEITGGDLAAVNGGDDTYYLESRRGAGIITQAGMREII